MIAAGSRAARMRTTLFMFAMSVTSVLLLGCAPTRPPVDLSQMAVVGTIRNSAGVEYRSVWADVACFVRINEVIVESVHPTARQVSPVARGEPSTPIERAPATEEGVVAVEAPANPQAGAPAPHELETPPSTTPVVADRAIGKSSSEPKRG